MYQGFQQLGQQIALQTEISKETAQQSTIKAVS